MGLLLTKNKEKNLYELEITTYSVHTYENQASWATYYERIWLKVPEPVYQ